MWESAFGYSGKVYQYLVNGETGKVSGSRPYSLAKIAAAVIAGIIALIILVRFVDGAELPENYNNEYAVVQEQDEIYNTSWDEPYVLNEEGVCIKCQ